MVRGWVVGGDGRRGRRWVGEFGAGAGAHGGVEGQAADCGTLGRTTDGGEGCGSESGEHSSGSASDTTAFLTSWG